MSIELKQLLPHPLKNVETTASAIWNKELTFKKGGKFQVFAPSGSGKTTLLHLLYGERKDYSGDFQIDNIPASLIDWDSFRMHKISIVFQDLLLFPELTALENVLLKNELTNHKSKEWIISAFENLQIIHRMDKPAQSLSRGEKQRVAIIRAMCMPFEYLLLDEPFSHLDDKNTEKAIALIKEEVFQLSATIVLANIADDNYFNYDQKVPLG